MIHVSVAGLRSSKVALYYIPTLVYMAIVLVSPEDNRMHSGQWSYVHLVSRVTVSVTLVPSLHTTYPHVPYTMRSVAADPHSPATTYVPMNSPADTVSVFPG